jgi:hypothetical protein
MTTTVSAQQIITRDFKIKDEEYFELEKEFGQLTKFESWELLRKNKKNNHTDEFDDIRQELLWSLCRAGCYYKRQVYIESSLLRCIEFAGGPKAIEMLLNSIINNEEIKPESYLKEEAEITLSRMTETKSSTSDFTMLILKELLSLWINRTRHGASRQKFGPYQEALLEKMLSKIVPKVARPNKDQILTIDNRFRVYCKSITWNTQKSMGRKITKEKALRAGLVSLADYDYLATAGNG